MKILNQLINFGKAFEQLTQVSQLAVVIALVFVAFSAGNCNGKTELDSFIVEYKGLQQNASNAMAYADSLQGKIETLTDSTRKQNEQIKSLQISISFRERERIVQRQELASLEARIEEAKTDSNLTSVIAIQDTAIVNLKEQVEIAEEIITEQNQIIEVQNTQIVSLNEALTLSTMRGDSLYTILSSLPPTPSNPDKIFFGLIRKPSRTTVAVVALAGGIIIGNQLRR